MILVALISIVGIVAYLGIERPNGSTTREGDQPEIVPDRAASPAWETILIEGNRLFAAGRYSEAQDRYMLALFSRVPIDPYAFERLIAVRRRLAVDDPALLRQEAEALEEAARSGRTPEHYTPNAIRLLAEASVIAASQIESERGVGLKTAGLPQQGLESNAKKPAAVLTPVLPPFDAPAPPPAVAAFRLAPDRVEVGHARSWVSARVTSPAASPEAVSDTPATANAILPGDAALSSQILPARTADAPVVRPIGVTDVPATRSCDGACGVGRAPLTKVEGEITAITDRVITLASLNGSLVRIVVMSTTRIDGQRRTVRELAPGDLVLTEGQLAPSGTLFAGSVNVIITADGRMADSAESIRISGQVAATSGVRLALRMRSGALLEVVVNSATEIIGNGHVVVMAARDTVSVEARVAQGRLLARKIVVVTTSDRPVEASSEVRENLGETPVRAPAGDTPNSDDGQTTGGNSATASQGASAQSGQRGQSSTGEGQNSTGQGHSSSGGPGGGPGGGQGGGPGGGQGPGGEHGGHGRGGR